MPKKSTKDPAVKRALDDFKEAPKNQFIDPDEPTIEDDAQEQSINEMLRYIVSQVPDATTVYAKLYKLSPLPEELAKHGILYLAPINNIADIDDIEIEVADMVKKNNWGSGLYQLRLFRTDKKMNKIIKVDLAINAPVDETGEFDPGTGFTQDAPKRDAFEDITRTAELAGKLKELSGGSNQNMSPDTLLKALSDSMNRGIEVTKQNTPAPGTVADPVTTMTAFIGALAPILTPIITQLMTRPIPVKEDPMDFLIKLKTAGLIQTPEANDPLAMLTKMKDMVELMGGMGGEGSGGKPNIMLEAIRMLAPQLPKMVGDVTSTIKSVADVSKLKLYRQLGVPTQLPPSKGTPSSPLISNTGNETVVEEQIIEGPIAEVPVMNPVVRQILDAIEKNDVEFYPKLKDYLGIYVNPGVVQSLVDGEIAEATFLETLSATLQQPFLASDQSKTYFNNFLNSLRPDPLKLVVAKCAQCGEEFDYEDQKAYDEDGKVCEGCGGTIEAIKINAVVGQA